MSGLFIVAIASDQLEPGRIDFAAMSDQSIIELLVENTILKSQLLDRNGDFKAVRAITQLDVDKDGYVTSIDFTKLCLGGTLNTTWLPSRLRRCNFERNNVQGRIERLSDAVYFADFSHNAFTGSLSLPDFPFQIRYFNASTNRLSGTLTFRQLRETLVVLNLSSNAFEGSLDLLLVNKKFEFYDVFRGLKKKLWNDDAIEGEKESIFVELGWNGFSGDILLRDFALVQ
uniref:Uncharacterized protein n=1 Tax=Paramoeba aestuarina TaxID=180227 RepID=A0A7S4L6R9_9EUKA|mmetsp:Transcript_32380/g.50667  ORF Transcript_32380/g.50667 Transcript_32380/m.50667 type:complete len:229 (+) Transcript_32380:41-727(+)|eukprot:CAMPEP_0201509402 /NCGR_PEP_ID=MMETSP0161_2-20130828/2469_1 /ASSEMBLY_ACC=CAM_ASM_000251 /TAXON_ID=180227 /ORGANISM="Neoparamoeba aestuarina, Strain SoJaBio B1-5/56/2" /LENGTH=228 /DNA_ID=CAMNT_0047904339 /DNA_START=22 /DNA_END=708 /DNA_ORIENTATION=-